VLCDQLRNWSDFPFTIAAGGIISGVTIPAGGATAAHRFLLANPAIDQAVPDTYLRHAEHQRRWRMSKFGSASPLNSADNQDYPDIPKFLNMDSDLDWFSECVAMATQQAKFFKHASNLGKFDWIGTQATGIFANVTTNANSFPVLQPTAQWYPEFRRGSTAYMTTWEDKIGPVPKLIAKHCLLNAKFDFHYAESTAANTVLHKHALLAAHRGAGYATRYGPWYNVDIAGNALDGTLTILKEDTRSDMKVLDRRDMMIIKDYYLAEGK